MLDAAIRDWVGKSADADGIEHPALYHMLDVAAVAERMIAHWDFPVPQQQAIVLLTALHDIGKISDSFQAAIAEHRPQRWRHPQLSFFLLSGFDPLFLEDVLGGNPRWRHRLYASTAGHHGAPPEELSQDQNRSVARAIGTAAMAAAEEITRCFCDLWPEAGLGNLDVDRYRALSWWLPGFVTACDWIGSNQSWFPAISPGPMPIEYLARRRPLAKAAICEAGLAATAPATTALFDFALRPMQQACADVPLADGPMLAIVEDETGSGKTEAALLLAQRLLCAGKGRGIYFALPTTATADAMFRRARGIVRRLFQQPPTLALAHSRALLSDDFRAVRGLIDDGLATEAGAPVCSDWLAEDRRLALLADVGIGTIDQALLSVLPTRFATLRHYALSSKILIVDEVHEMGEPYLHTELLQLLKMHRMADGSAILLTATLPLAQRAQLMKAWDDDCGRDPAYPCLSVSGSGRPAAVAAVGSPRGPVAVERLPDAESAAKLISALSAGGAACVWVRNAVDDAIAGVDMLRARGVDAMLLHARFALGDRLRHERRALDCFGKEGRGRAGQVLVSTQVVESSLDLDFDVMVSDLAPMAALVQRAGRLWRHMDLRPAADRPVPAPVLHVVSPDPAEVADDRWLRQALDRGAFVYPLDLQWRTADTLFRVGRIDAPAGLRALIEAVHGEMADLLPAALQAAEDEHAGDALAKANQATRNTIRWEDGYLKGGGGAPDTDYPTRLGQPQRTLLLARTEGERLVPLAGDGNSRELALSEVQASRARLKSVELPDQEIGAIAALKAGWRKWRQEAVTVCPVDEDGLIADGLRYDPERGLLFDR